MCYASGSVKGNVKSTENTGAERVEEQSFDLEGKEMGITRAEQGQEREPRERLSSGDL
jgi:hypothetical protein